MNRAEIRAKAYDIYWKRTCTCNTCADQDEALNDLIEFMLDKISEETNVAYLRGQESTQPY